MNIKTDCKEELMAISNASNEVVEHLADGEGDSILTLIAVDNTPALVIGGNENALIASLAYALYREPMLVSLIEKALGFLSNKLENQASDEMQEVQH